MKQSARTAGAEGLQLLDEVVAAYRAALEVYTREQWPQQWALAQNNLGSALAGQGERAAESERPRLLGEAVAAYRAALQVRTPEQWPQDWALTQYNLGNTLTDLGELVGPSRTGGGAEGQHRLGEAVAAYRAALQVYTREQWPQQWARTQNNLGSALLDQGRRAGPGRTRGPGGTGDAEGPLRPSGPDLLGEAVAAFREALQVRTREQMPDSWARTQRNLAIALKALAKVSPGEEGQKLQTEADAIDRELAGAKQ